VVGRADAVALPGSTDQVAATVAWCYRHDIPIVPRGGGTGFAAGAVPLEGGVVLSLERLTAVRSFEPLLWRLNVEAGVRTSEVRRIARESGLFFPPDPGAAEQSQIGGNIATNAGGPHAFKYGVTGLLVGSEGTLGVVTAAWLRLLPVPEAALPVAAFYPDADAGCEALGRVLGNGLTVAALEFLDGVTLELAGRAFPGDVPPRSGFLVLAEADGTAEEATRLRDELVDVLGEAALGVVSPEGPAVGELWRWRDGVSIAVGAVHGGKVSEDIVVPFDRLAEAIEETIAIGQRHDLVACSWGHAGDGNLHSTFLVSPGDEDELARAGGAAGELFVLATRLGGSVSGEHGLGWLKRGQLERQWAPRALELHAEIKRVFDPKGLLNPGKKVAYAG
jgi:glycolate dehydrogenase FAD-linked subunit